MRASARKFVGSFRMGGPIAMLTGAAMLFGGAAAQAHDGGPPGHWKHGYWVPPGHAYYYSAPPVFYAPAPVVVYRPPPVVYEPVYPVYGPPPGLNLNFNVPLR